MQLIKVIFLSCLLPSLLTVASANGDFQLDVSPTEIKIGLSDSLNLNCTFSTTANHDIVSLISLILSRAKSAQQPFTEIATISDYTGHSVNLLTTDDVQATGVFNSAAKSFLNLRWEYPREEQAGEYKCTAQGVGPLGHIVVLHDVIQVTAHEPSVDDLKDKVKDMDLRMKLLEQHDSKLANSVHILEQKVTSFGQDRLNNMSIMFEEEYLTYNNHIYYVSNHPFYRIEASYAICHVFGGWLVEIDDVEEYRAIQNFLRKSGFSRLIISGTDEAREGTWVLPSTNQPLPYIDWSPHNADEGRSRNCLMLWFHTNAWRMWDWDCNIASPSFSCRFMCEIPNY